MRKWRKSSRAPRAQPRQVVSRWDAVSSVAREGSFEGRAEGEEGPPILEGLTRRRALSRWQTVLFSTKADLFLAFYSEIISSVYLVKLVKASGNRRL